MDVLAFGSSSLVGRRAGRALAMCSVLLLSLLVASPGLAYKVEVKGHLVLIEIDETVAVEGADQPNHYSINTGKVRQLVDGLGMLPPGTSYDGVVIYNSSFA
jgi:hypothetical protein